MMLLSFSQVLLPFEGRDELMYVSKTKAQSTASQVRISRESIVRTDRNSHRLNFAAAFQAVGSHHIQAIVNLLRPTLSDGVHFFQTATDHPPTIHRPSEIMNHHGLSSLWRFIGVWHHVALVTALALTSVKDEKQ